MRVTAAVSVFVCAGVFWSGLGPPSLITVLIDITSISLRAFKLSGKMQTVGKLNKSPTVPSVPQ